MQLNTFLEKVFSKERNLKLLSFFFLGSVFVVFLTITTKQAFQNPYQLTCEFVEKRLYLPAEKTAGWYKECLDRSRLATAFTRTYRIVNDFNETTKQLQVSHLQLYWPEEYSNYWGGIEKSNGIKSKFVDGKLVIFEVQPDSSAYNLGLRFGDIIISINNETPSAEAANLTEGEFEIERGPEIKRVNLVPTELTRDDSIYVRPLTANAALVRVPSFRSAYFSMHELNRMVEQVGGRRKIILDLRDNRGGNFVAGLRLLSVFLCGSQEVGYFQRPREKDFKEKILPDDLDDEAQLSLLEHNSLVRLRTFEDYPCLASSMAVLVDSETASTAELVAQALRDYNGAKVFGVRTAAELLVSVWHPLPWFPLIKDQKISVSVPEALYQTKAGRVIEGAGVRPDKELYYDLKDFKSGFDSWVLKALNSL